jgi:hypothetical protein
MTPEQHNKYLAVAHLVYGGLFLLFMMAMIVMFVFIIALEMGKQQQPNDPPAAFFIFLFGFMFVFYTLIVVPSFVAGYALLKRKPWARIASIIGGVVAGMNFPLGTAVCVYTLWFLFSEPGKLLYDRPANALPSPPTSSSNAAINSREQQYQPPDWR